MNEAGKKAGRTGLTFALGTIAIIVFAGLLLRPKVTGQSHLDWMTDLPKAQEKARAEKKWVFVNFGGSDWCPPCQALDRRVFHSEEFARFAQKNLVLVNIDLPLRKPQPDALREANNQLVERFGVNPLPTLILLDLEGKEVFRLEGYDGSPPEKMISTFQQAIQRAKQA